MFRIPRILGSSIPLTEVGRSHGFGYANHDALFPFLTLSLHRAFRIPWSHPTPPYHLHQFTEHSLDELMRRANLRIPDRQYAPCGLHYELGETHILRACREALAARRWALAAGRFVVALFTAAAYAGIYVVDRCCFWKRKDFEMRYIVKKAANTDGSNVGSELRNTLVTR